MKDGVSLYGGFAGTETSKDAREMETVANVSVCKTATILNADDDVADSWVRAIEPGSS